MKHPITGSQLSGNSYIPALLRNDFGGEYFPLLVRPKARCYCTTRDDSITSTICVDCARSWCYDFTLRFERTAAGRRLAEQLDITDYEMACKILRKR